MSYHVRLLRQIIRHIHNHFNSFPNFKFTMVSAKSCLK